MFDYLSDVGHLPDYLPPITDASRKGEDGIALKGEIKGQEFTNEGYLRADRGQRRLEWGADAERTYSGFLTVQEAGGGSLVSVTLRFGPNSPDAQMQEQAGEDRDPVQEALAATLESVRRQVTGEGGKVLPPEPPGPPPVPQD